MIDPKTQLLRFVKQGNIEGVYLTIDEMDYEFLSQRQRYKLLRESAFGPNANIFIFKRLLEGLDLEDFEVLSIMDELFTKRMPVFLKIVVNDDRVNKKQKQIMKQNVIRTNDPNMLQVFGIKPKKTKNNKCINMIKNSEIEKFESFVDGIKNYGIPADIDCLYKGLDYAIVNEIEWPVESSGEYFLDWYDQKKFTAKERKVLEKWDLIM